MRLPAEASRPPVIVPSRHRGAKAQTDFFNEISPSFPFGRHEGMRPAVSEGLEHEIGRLATADRHIAEAEQTLSAYLRHVEQMRRNGEDLSATKRLLAKLDRTLIEWRTQRDMLVGRIRSLRLD